MNKNCRCTYCKGRRKLAQENELMKYLIKISYTHEVEGFNEAQAILKARKQHEEHIRANGIKGSFLDSIERQ